LNIAEIRYEFYSGGLYDSFDLAKKDFAYSRGRIVYAKNDSIARQIKETLDQCIRKMWHCTPETPDSFMVAFNRASELF
jgi:hypothetical protein